MAHARMPYRSSVIWVRWAMMEEDRLSIAPDQIGDGPIKHKAGRDFTGQALAFLLVLKIAYPKPVSLLLNIYLAVCPC